MFGCEYCHRTDGHYSICPNYKPKKSYYYCSICEESIQNGEEYIVNDNGEYAHWECVDHAKDLVKFLGYEIKEMEVDDY